MSSVLLFHRDSDLSRDLAFWLRAESHRVEVASSLATAVDIAKLLHPDLMLLENSQPARMGLRIIARLAIEVPRIRWAFAFVGKSPTEKLLDAGLKSGALAYFDAFLNAKEGAGKIRTLLQSLPPKSMASRSETFGKYRIDRETGRFSIGEEVFQLSPTETRLISLLLTKSDQIVTRAELLKSIWDKPAESATRTVDAHVLRLKKKIGPHGKLIKTVPGVGIIFVSPNP